MVPGSPVLTAGSEHTHRAFIHMADAGSMAKKALGMIGLFAGAVLFTSCGGDAETSVPPAAVPRPAITGARIVGDYVSVPFVGDIWTATWAADGTLYAAFGDGTGMTGCLPTLVVDEPDEFDAGYTEVAPGRFLPDDPDSNEYCEVFGCDQALPLCPYTPAGLVRLDGRLPDIETCDGPDQCVVARHLPYGDLRVFEASDKPSSLLAVGDRLYAAMHAPPGEADVGYVAVSEDGGRTWRKVEGSPWTGDSPFTVLMFIQMGQGFDLARDGYVYALGIADELGDPPRTQLVHLARVPTDAVARYDAYRYLAGFDTAGAPQWSADPADAVPVDGLETMAQGAAMFHEGSGQYLFLSGLTATDGTGTLFAAPEPWGPWYRVADLQAGFIAGVVPKGATDDSLWFTAAGGGGLTYNLHLGRIRLDVDAATRPPAVRVLRSEKVEQLIGDWDFETLQPTRQQTESRFNVAFTDLGSPFEFDGRLWFLFGDTDPESPGWDPRHDDTIAWTDATTARDLRLEFLTDPEAGRGVLNPRIACEDGPDCVDLGALNVPVAGLGDGETMFVWFTADGAERSLVARSDDGGRTFVELYDFGDTHFIDIAVSRIDETPPGLEGEGPWVLVFGSGDAEHADIYLAATPLDALRRGDRSAVRFLAGAAGGYTWSTEEADAVALFEIEHGPGPGVMSEVPHGWGFGEPLVTFDPTLDLWLVTYNSARTTIRLRTAPEPWGPWSGSVVLFDPRVDYGKGPAYGRFVGDDRTERLGGQGELYGPYLIPRFTEVRDDGTVDLYWLLSTWQPYTVVLMKSTVTRR